MKKYYAERSHKDMLDVLMSKEAKGPAVHYYMIRGGDEKTNITVWEQGLVGAEYIKSYGHYHIGSVEEKYKILQGEGILIIQERETNSFGKHSSDEIKSFQAKKIKAGDEILIPPSSGHLIVNTGKTWLVTSDNSPFSLDNKESAGLPMHADYESFKKLHGAAYYVVEKHGKPELVKNPNYKKVPDAKIE